MRSCLLLMLLLAIPFQADAASKEATLADQVVPRTVRLSFAAEQVFVSVRSRVTPVVLGERTWARFDRNSDGMIGPAERGALKAEMKRQETGHLGVTVDGAVVPMRSLALRIEQPEGDSIPLDATIVLRVEGKVRVALAAGLHRFSVYDQPRGKDGVVPFRIGFARGLRVLSGGGARGEIRGGGKRLEVVSTKLSPIFWGVFERVDESASKPNALEGGTRSEPR